MLFRSYVQRVQVVSIARDLDRQLLDMRRHVREFVATGNEANAKAATEIAGTVRNTVETGLATSKNPERRGRFEEIGRDFDEYAGNFRDVVAMRRESDKLVAEGLDVEGPKAQGELEGVAREASRAGNSNAAIHAQTSLLNLMVLRLRANKLMVRHDAKQIGRAHV